MMILSLKNICHAELIKMMKRKDFLSLLGIVGIGILFSVSILTDSYIGAEQQGTLYWIVTQMLNSSILFIAPMILAYSAIRSMAQEIENGSLKLFNQRIRNRERLYLAKSITLWIYSTLFLILCIVIHFILYFLIVCRSERYASGTVFGENTSILISILICLYCSTFVLVPQIVLFFGTFAKQGICIGGIFMLVLIVHNIYKIPIIGYLSPWRYIINLANNVLNTTQYINMPQGYVIENVLLEIGLCGIICAGCIFCGKNILSKKDL